MAKEITIYVTVIEHPDSIEIDVWIVESNSVEDKGWAWDLASVACRLLVGCSGSPASPGGRAGAPGAADHGRPV